MDENIENLKAMISERDEEIRLLKLQLKEKNAVSTNASLPTEVCEKDLSADEIMRYSRQLIMPEIGMRGQIALKKASVLIVGAGGLGCPAAIYLAAAGVGEIGIVDYDKVDLTNLHRQVAHVVSSVGREKCLSLLRSIKNINPHVKCNIYSVLLNKNNIEKIIQKYEIIIDASDNVPTRYLLNDASVLNKKVLVSGSALRFEGQLTVYNYLDGPCYRCLFPDPPPPNATTSCAEGGVLGAVTGVIGCLQALEVIKITIGLHPSYYKKMLVFDGLSGDIRVIKLRNKKSDCKICGNEPTIKQLVDYELFCNTSATDKDENISLLPSFSRITCKEYKKL
ncbi:Adenylyltransferase and sulfurtransferase MOCS3, partial [Stegodyphus mimosarum]